MLSFPRVRIATILPMLMFVLACTAIARAEDAPAVHVELQSGRILTGQVDPRTNVETLWLRNARGTDESRITIRRPIDWSRVVTAYVGTKQYSGAQFQQVAESFQTPAQPVWHRETPAPEVLVAPAAYIGPAPIAGPPPVCPVRSLKIDAGLGHWTGTVETDGFVLVINPLDADGRLTPIDGTLEVDLIGEQPVNGRQGDVSPRIGRWTEAVHVEDFGLDGARYELPFQAVHPDFNTDFGHLGLMHARLTVPGQGSFDTSTDQIRIRPYSAVRDRSEQIRGTRFFPVERTGRGLQFDLPPRP